MHELIRQLMAMVSLIFNGLLLEQRNPTKIILRIINPKIKEHILYRLNTDKAH